jgi:hypothetical protein
MKQGRLSLVKDNRGTTIGEIVYSVPETVAELAAARGVDPSTLTPQDVAANRRAFTDAGGIEI